MAIVGISGSPISNSNTDRMIQAVLGKSGKETKFIKLSKLNYAPCRACAHLYATTNMCGVKDELQPFIADIRDAEALVFGTPVHDGQMTGWMYSLFTRLWCLHHVHMLLKDKPVLFIATGLGGYRQGKVDDIYKMYLREYHPQKLGEIYYCSIIPPCLTCGAGEYCMVGGMWSMCGRNEKKVKKFMDNPDRFHKWEDEPDMVEKMEIYGEILSKI